MARASDYFRVWLRWERGRQLTGYDKMLLLASPFPIPFDCYILRFPEGSEIPPHKDPVTGRRHYRLNIILKQPPRGGEFVCRAPILNYGRVKLFRSDASDHGVTRVIGGRRYVLSIGWALR